MPGFNGAGTFVRTYNWAQDAANAVPILASRFDTEHDGFASGLSNCICRDGQSTISADIPFNSKKITGLGDASGVTDALNLQTADARYLRKGFPFNAQSTNYTLVLGDAGKTIYRAAGTGTGSISYTIPLNSSVAFDVGTLIRFYNLSGGSLAIAVADVSISVTRPGGGAVGTIASQSGGGLVELEKIATNAWSLYPLGSTSVT